MSAEGSVSRWLGQLRAGDPQAAAGLWQRYFERLVTVARGRLQGAAYARVGPDRAEEHARAVRKLVEEVSALEVELARAEVIRSAVVQRRSGLCCVACAHG